jgi:hypothetical protein
MPIVKSYDPECESLAEHFLRHEPNTRDTYVMFEARVKSLALAIQQAVEDWCADNPAQPAAHVNPGKR